MVNAKSYIMKFPLSAVLVIVCTYFISCTKEDSPHPIVGTWQIDYVTQAGQALPLDRCAQQTTVAFTTAGIFNEKRFSPKISGCFLNRDQGVWVDNGDNRMTITYDDGHADFQNTTYQITTNALLFTKGITPNTIVVAFKKIE